MTPFYEDSAVTIYHGDCRAILPTLDAVDHVITDPPYSEHVHGKQRRGGSAHRDGVMCDGRELGFVSLTPELRRLAATHIQRVVRRWALVFSDVENAHEWRSALTGDRNATAVRGVAYVDPLEYVRTMFWRKAGGAPQFTGDRPAVACEAMTLCHRSGRKKWNGGGKQGFYDVPIVVAGNTSSERCHTTQKPLALMEALVSDFTDEGDLILDPFGGSGTTAVAAKKLGRRCILIEREEKYCEVAARRLSIRFETLAGGLFAEESA